MDMVYKDIIKKFKDKENLCICFSVLGYNHYSNCIIEAHFETLPNSNNSVYIIRCKLTKDSSEDVSFINGFKENYKLFDFGRKGTFTLKQIWSKLNIKELKN